MELSKDSTYDEVCAALTERLRQEGQAEASGLEDPQQLRFTGQQSWTATIPKSQPFKHHAWDALYQVSPLNVTLGTSCAVVAPCALVRSMGFAPGWPMRESCVLSGDAPAEGTPPIAAASACTWYAGNVHCDEAMMMKPCKLDSGRCGLSGCDRETCAMQAMHHYGQALEVLFYEVLDMPLTEYEQLKHMKVSHINPMQTSYCWRTY